MYFTDTDIPVLIIGKLLTYSMALGVERNIAVLMSVTWARPGEGWGEEDGQTAGSAPPRGCEHGTLHHPPPPAPQTYHTTLYPQSP